MCADALAGDDEAWRPFKAWVEIHRMLDHAVARKARGEVGTVGFPPEIQEFAKTFVNLQMIRHSADYNPVFKLNAAEVSSQIDEVKKRMADLKSVDKRHKIAFAVWVLARGKGVSDSRAYFRKGLDRRGVDPRGKPLDSDRGAD